MLTLKTDGEANVFRLAYEEDLASDVDSIDDDPLPERQRERSATVEESAARNYVETVNMLRERAKKNRVSCGPLSLCNGC